MEVNKKVVPLHSQFEQRGERSSDERLAQKNNLKNFAKRFGELKIMRTFAAPFGKRETEKFIEKTDYCTRSKYREKYNLSRSVNFFGNYEVSVSS